MDFNSFLANLNSMGFYDFVLPWILFLVIFFVIIEVAPFLKDNSKKKQIAVVIAAILAFFTVNFPVNGIPLGMLLSNLFGWTGVYVAAILVVILFLGMGGVKIDEIFGSDHPTAGKIVLVIVMVLLAIMVLAQVGIPLFQLNEMAWTFIFVVILIGGAIVVLGSDDKKKGAEGS